jgi:FdhD protein
MAAATDRLVGARKWARGRLDEVTSAIAEETPVALVYNGVSHVVMMATPADLEDFALGFSLSEGIVRSADDILEIETANAPPGIEVRLRVTARRFQALKDRRRNLAGRTGCGLCGVDSLQQAVRPVQPVTAAGPIAFEAIERALDALGDAQTINRRTRSLHAAGFADRTGKLLAVCEDVGRHNALDKLIGRLAREHIDPADGFALVTSRCSFELVQKALTVGIHTLAAISAPTALALDMAEQAGLTLIALARSDSFILFTHGDHLVATAPAEMQKVES